MKTSLLNLSPLIITKATFKGKTLSINPPLEIKPELDETGNVFVAYEADLEIDIYVEFRDILEEVIAEQLFFLWDVYAMKDDSKLTKDARKLKSKLKNRLTCEKGD